MSLICLRQNPPTHLWAERKILGGTTKCTKCGAKIISRWGLATHWLRKHTSRRLPCGCSIRFKRDKPVMWGSNLRCLAAYLYGEPLHQ